MTGATTPPERRDGDTSEVETTDAVNSAKSLAEAAEVAADPTEGAASASSGSPYDAREDDRGWVAAPVDGPADDRLPAVSVLAQMQDELTRRLDELQKAIVQTTALQEHHAAMVQKLHAENQSLRQGELTQAMKPFILDVARLHDDVERVIQSAGDELAKAAPIPEFILDVLDRHGVTQVRPSAGDPFDSKVHQGLKVASTSDKSLNGKVESVIRPGFIGDGEHLVRPAQVVVFRYAAEAEPVAPAAPEALTDDASPASAASPTTQFDQTRSDDVG
jgi:molecular chaperone GrpE (heat shock protein)